jgi:hypothetical protein
METTRSGARGRTKLTFADGALLPEPLEFDRFAISIRSAPPARMPALNRSASSSEMMVMGTIGLRGAVDESIRSPIEASAADADSVEARSILTLCKGDALRAFDIVQSQLATLVLRMQAILGLTSIVITVTGFSGRTIAQTSDLARITVVTGLFLVLAASAVGVAGVLRLRWSTQEIGSDPLETLAGMIAIRDGKARFLTAVMALFVVGFSLYCFAVAQLLLAA